MPVHGEYRHLVHHAQLARDVGVADDHVLVCEDGDVVTLTAEGADVERRAVPAGYMYVDGIVGDIGHGVLRDRRVLAEEGVVVVIVTVDTADRRDRDRSRDRHARLGVRARGRRPASRTPSRSCATRSPTPRAEGATDFDTMRRHARRSLGQFIDERTRRRPIVIPVVMEV